MFLVPHARVVVITWIFISFVQAAVIQATCTGMEVSSGDTCASLATKCGVSGDAFMRFNQVPDLCSTLTPGENVCCPGSGAEGTAVKVDGRVISTTQTSGAQSKNTQNPDDWRSQQCTDEVIIDAAIDPQKRWDGVNCDDAWKDALVRWENPTMEGQLSFPEAVSNFFHGPENLRCDITTDHNGCDAFRQCHDTNHPAGYLILNSMVALNNIIMNFYDAIVRAQSLISDSMNEITKTFAPKPKDETQALKIVLDVLGLSYALFAAPFWNMAMKRLPYFGDRSDQHGASKDTVNGAVSYAITIIKDKLPSPGDMNNDLTKGLAQVAALWYDSTSEMKKQLFNGSEPSVASLTSLIEDGKLLANAYEPVDDPTIQAMISKALYSILIPLAWSLAPNFSPVVMDAHAQCDMIDPLVPDEMSLVTSQRTWTCHDGWLYYLVTTEGSAQKCFGSPMSRQGERCEDLPFSAAPGIETLDGTSWAGLTREDIIHGAVNSFNANGKKNGGKPLGPTLTVDDLNSIQELSVTAPGVINIPVCDAAEARQNWIALKMWNKRSANFPCN